MDYNAKITETEKILTDHNHHNNITTTEFNKLTAENFSARLKQANLITKQILMINLKSLKQKINLHKTKHLLVKNKLKN